MNQDDLMHNLIFVAIVLHTWKNTQYIKWNFMLFECMLVKEDKNLLCNYASKNFIQTLDLKSWI